MTEHWFNTTTGFLKDSLEKIRIALEWDKANLKTGG